MLRCGVNIPPLELTKAMHDHLSLFDSIVRGALPCSAVKKFEEISEVVHCESTQARHGDVHQSSKTYFQTTIRDGSFAKLFGSKDTVVVPCRWEGTFEYADEEYPFGWFVDSKLTESGVPSTWDDFVNNHKKVLQSQKRILKKLHKSILQVCLACLLGDAEEVLDCGHLLCTTCCKEFLHGRAIECPFCDKLGEWQCVDIPHHAGVRVLEVDGLESQGLSVAVLLQQIEERLGINVHNLFDLIVGKNTGALIALGFGVHCMSGTRVVDQFRKVSPAMLPRTKATRISEPIYFNVRSLLTDLPPPKRLFVGSRHMPRVAVEVPDFFSFDVGYSYSKETIAVRVETLAFATQACFGTRTKPHLSAFDEASTLWGREDFEWDSLDIFLDIGMR
jgi:hypothetical protein